MLFVQPKFGRHRAANKGRFDGVHQDVLRIAVTILEHPKQLGQFRMHAMNTDLDQSALAGLLDGLLDLLLGLANNFLNPSRMNAAVRNQLFKRHASDLSADRIVARNHDRFRGVIDNDVNAGGCFDCANIAALTSNDSAFHLVGSLRASTETVRSATNSPMGLPAARWRLK